MRACMCAHMHRCACVRHAGEKAARLPRAMPARRGWMGTSTEGRGTAEPPSTAVVELTQEEHAAHCRRLMGDTLTLISITINPHHHCRLRSPPLPPSLNSPAPTASCACT